MGVIAWIVIPLVVVLLLIVIVKLWRSVKRESQQAESWIRILSEVESETKAIQAIQEKMDSYSLKEVESLLDRYQRLQQKIQALSEAGKGILTEPLSQLTKSVDQNRKALELLRSQLADREALLARLESVSRVFGDSDRVSDALGLVQRAEQVYELAEYILREYGWALQQGQISALSDAMEQVHSFEGSPSEGIGKISALSALLENLPEAVLAFVSLRMTIANAIAPSNENLAREWSGQLQKIEHSFRSGKAEALGDLANFAQVVMGEATRIGSRAGHTRN